MRYGDENDEMDSSQRERADANDTESTSSSKNSVDGDNQQQGECNGMHSNWNFENNSEMLLNFLVNISKRLSQGITRIFQFILGDLGINQILDRFVQWCVLNPQKAFCLLTAALMMSLPILLFVAFLLSTIAMTLTGFLVLEGTLLTLLSMIMFGLLGALGFALLIFVLVVVATYFGVSHVYDMYGSTENQRRSLRNIFLRNNIHFLDPSM